MSVAPTLVGMIKVEHEFKEGSHIFTSEDVDGLLVIHHDFATAYRDVAPAIKTLLKHNAQIECEILPLMSLAEILEENPDWRATRIPPPTERHPTYALLPKVA
ncbi:MAG: hypothetical protein OXG03_05040 [Gammaproteobacteria bacterium]|nr:hypothetical protein [Gammaproteobacteria bacterium]